MWGLFAYTWWGLVPLYFAVLKGYGLSAGEILAQRITWSWPLLLLLVASSPKRRDELRGVMGDGSLLVRLSLSASLLAVNWLLYIYATVTERVTEASQGYFMMPLIHAVLGTVVLGERLRPAQYPALALVGLSVALPVLLTGRWSWLAIALPLTFGLYSLVRKQAAVESAVGLTVETCLLLPPSVGYLLWLTQGGENHFGPDAVQDLWIIASGIVTVAPLLAFTLSLRRLPLLAVSFLQFISPTVQMLLAVTVLGEELDPVRLASFTCVWLAVLIFLADALLVERQRMRQWASNQAMASPGFTSSPTASTPR
jgi:chloramphenicol-sensitive protein RarD